MRRTQLAWLGGMLVAAAMASTVSPPADTAEQRKMTPEQQQATAAIHEYFRRVTTRLANDCLADVTSRENWEHRRPRLRQQLLDMLGLSPLPPKTKLHATVTGAIEHDDFVVEKLHFQSMPQLYVTANFYRPKKVDKPLPTVLYLCGHGNTKIDGVSYGSKVNYPHHPTCFVRNGYCCLSLDTHCRPSHWRLSCC